MGVVISLVIGLALCELYIWLPKISEAIVARAILRIPDNDRARERYREEWQAHLADLPNSTARLFLALCLWVSCFQIRATLLDTYNTTLKGIAENVRLRLEYRAIAISSQRTESDRYRREFHRLYELLQASADESKIWRDFVGTIGTAYEKADMLRTLQLDKEDARNNLANVLVTDAILHINQITNKKPSSRQNEEILAEVTGSLYKAITILQDKDNTILKQHDSKVTAAAAEELIARKQFIAVADGLIPKSEISPRK